MAERAYLSIGEVLSLLQDEFPDVTISKIRFLESQGLLDPERTPSGYRKFYEGDVERLRWILRQQRENFLPLKVIKGRLLGERDDEDEDAAEAAPVEPTPAPSSSTGPTATSPAAATPADTGPVQPVTAQPMTAQPVGQGAVEAQDDAAVVPAIEAAPSRRGAAGALSDGITGVTLTLEEVAAATGQTPDRIRDMERAGFIVGRTVADDVYYDEDSLVVAKLVSGFARFGIEPRHLRIYKNSAERESGLFQQVIVPLLKQRNPEARRRAVETLEELSDLGERLRAAMLRQAIKGMTGG